MKRRVGMIAVAFLLLVAILVPVPLEPPGSTRVIVDYTLRVYITPGCFEQANPTNHLSEMTLKEAKKTGYSAEAPCSEEKLAPASQSLLMHMKQRVGTAPVRY